MVSPHSHGISEITATSATTTRFSSISPAPANSPPNTLDQISGAGRRRVLYLEVGGVNWKHMHHLMERISAVHRQTGKDITSEWRLMESRIS